MKPIFEENGRLCRREQRILYNRDGGIGDILMLLPALRSKADVAGISLVTKYPELLEGIHWLRPVVKEYPTQVFYHHKIDLNGGVEPKTILKVGQTSVDDYCNKSRIDVWFDLIDAPKPDYIELEYHVKEEEIEWAKTLMKGDKDKKNIIYVLNSTSPYRTYPLILTNEVIKELNKKYNVFIVGNGFGKEHKFQYNGVGINLCNMLSIRQLASLIKNADLTISPDSGPLHLAAALKKPCVALFANTNPNLRINYYPLCNALWKPLPCHCEDQVGCLPCPARTYIEKQHNIGAPCAWNITPNDIINKVNIMLDDPMPTIKSFCFGLGKSLSDINFIFNKDEFKNIEAPYDWVYTGKCHNGPNRLEAAISMASKQLRPNGHLIINEIIGQVNPLRNTNRKLCLDYVKDLIKNKNEFNIIFEEKIINKNEFLIIARKK